MREFPQQMHEGSRIFFVCLFVWLVGWLFDCWDCLVCLVLFGFVWFCLVLFGLFGFV